MSSVSCRLLPFLAADGPHNMAADEVLLEGAVAGVASLRFYTWSEPTLSLGYFQPERLRHEDEKLSRLAFVRRPSGGMTLVHDHELTYALALPAGRPWQMAGQAVPWPCRMHALIGRVLSDWGIQAAAAACKTTLSDARGLCFQHATPGDLLIGATKVVGSAQRRQRGALLQHGAILLAASPAAPGLPGVAELSGRRLAPSELAAAVARAWETETGWPLVPSSWTQAETRRIDELVATKYTQDAWNRKR
jgi:lipoate-protein ligase A